MPLKVHAICLALNEEPFIGETLKSLYPFCSGISVISQYDRDWYCKPIVPDLTAQVVLNFPDPEGKIHFNIRRHRDEAAARNQEMLAFQTNYTKGIVPFSASREDILEFYSAPDYFLIVDADEIYDIDTLGNIIDFLDLKKPRGMRVLGYNYVRTWNRRVPSQVIHFQHFGFIKPGVLFKMNRIVSFTERRFNKVGSILKLPNLGSKLQGFIDCPPEIGVFHHGCWLGDDQRLRKKVTVSGHPQSWDSSFSEWVDSLSAVFVSTPELPRNIQEGNWPEHYLEQNPLVLASNNE